MKSLIVLVALCMPVLCRADVQGRVIGVSDGDTITVLDSARHQHKIRLAGIDAPEKSQAFGQRSKQALSECAFGKEATVEGDKIDRYGRLVGKVMAQGLDCNLRQVELGLAWHYKQFQKEQSSEDRQRYGEMEARASANRAGLWADPEPIPPWDFRKP